MSDTGNNDGEQGGGSGLYAPGAKGEVHTYDATDEKGSRRPMLLLGVLLLIAAFGGVLYIAYEQGMKEGVRPPPPVLKADNTPAKVAPDQPGGMTIPHQDKSVYDQITGDSSAPPLEQLLPRAEEPMRIPPADAGGANPPAPALADSDSGAGIGAKDMEILPPAIELPMPPVAAAPTAPVQVEQPTTLAQAVPRTETPPEAPETIVPQAESPAPPQTDTPAVAPARPEPQVIETPGTATGSHVVQIAAFRDQPSAEKEFQVLKKKYPDLLGALSQDIQRADLGAKGIYYRLRVGPFNGKDPATKLCTELKARGQECIVRPR